MKFHCILGRFHIIMYDVPQKRKLEELRGSRDQSAVEAALNALTDCATGKGGNLLELSVQVRHSASNTVEPLYKDTPE